MSDGASIGFAAGALGGIMYGFTSTALIGASAGAGALLFGFCGRRLDGWIIYL